MSIVLKFEVPPGKPVLRGQDHFWRTILVLDGEATPWRITDVQRHCSGRLDRSTIRDFVKRLVAGGFAEIASGDGNEPGYRLLRKPITTPRLRRDGTVAEQGRAQVQMWNTIRGPLGRGGFTVADVALYGSTAAIPIPRETAASYVKHLVRAGYFVTLRKGKAGQPALYRLKPSHAGALPPLILRSQVVFDQNRGEALGPAVEVREVAP